MEEAPTKKDLRNILKEYKDKKRKQELNLKSEIYKKWVIAP